MHISILLDEGHSQHHATAHGSTSDAAGPHKKEVRAVECKCKFQFSIEHDQKTIE